MRVDIVRTSLRARAVVDLDGVDPVAGLRFVADQIREEVVGELNEDGLPKHLAIGVNANGDGPVDEHDPDYDRTVCWCMEPDCREHNNPPSWYARVADWLDASANDLERRGVTAKLKSSEHAAIAMARSYLAWILLDGPGLQEEG